MISEMRDEAAFAQSEEIDAPLADDSMPLRGKTIYLIDGQTR